jgi:hypothetical protein
MKYTYGTIPRSIWDSPYHTIRDRKGRFAKFRAAVGKPIKLPRRFIFTSIFFALLLGTIFISFWEADEVRKEMVINRKNLIEYMGRENKATMDATLGQLAQVEADRASLDGQMFNLTNDSVNLTKSLKEQVITQRKVNALK